MRKHHKGTIAIEAALGLPILLILVFTWFDLCLMGYAFSVSDHALMVAVTETKKLGRANSNRAENYKKAVSSALETSAGILWPKVIQEKSVRAKVHYFKDYKDLTLCSTNTMRIEKCPYISNKPKNMALAIYSLEFKYKPLFNFYIPPMKINREYIVIHERERCKFKYGIEANCD